MRRLQVLYLPHPVPELHTPWGEHALAAISAHHDVRILDRGKPLDPQFAGIEAIVDLGGQITADEVAAAGRAGGKYLQVQTNGLDHVDVDGIRNAGMMLAHCPGELSSVALAESAMMFILMMAHAYGEARSEFHAGKFYFPTGLELEGRCLVIVGFGASGQQLAKRARAFGMRIMGIDTRQIDQDVLDEIQPEFMGRPADLDRVLTHCDFLSVHLHLTNETRHMIDARRIGLLKPTACVVNVARGALIDEDALYEAVLDGRIGGASLDAFTDEPPDPTRPVYQFPNVYVTPHTAGSTDGTNRKRAAFAAANLDRFARGEELHARVI